MYQHDVNHGKINLRIYDIKDFMLNNLYFFIELILTELYKYVIEKKTRKKIT